MQVQTLDLSRFIGGQCEIEVDGGLLERGGKLYRGDIESIEVDQRDLHIVFSRLAVMFNLASGWELDTNRGHLDFRLALLTPLKRPDGFGRIIIDATMIFDQLIVLFPQGYAPHGDPKRLDLSQVRLLCTDPAELARFTDTHVPDDMYYRFLTYGGDTR